MERETHEGNGRDVHVNVGVGLPKTFIDPDEVAIVIGVGGVITEIEINSVDCADVAGRGVVYQVGGAVRTRPVERIPRSAAERSFIDKMNA